MYKTEKSRHKKSRHRKPKMRRRLIFAGVAALILAVVVLVLSLSSAHEAPEETTQAQTVSETTAETTPETTAVYVAGEATIGVTGDILIHNPVLKAAIQSDGSYDFSSMFEAISPYWQEVDYMIVNLEVTISESGSYSGYPMFRSPASIIEALSDAGVDCLLTANNHSYDGYESGMLYTIETIEAAGLDYTGTRSSSDESYVLIKNINGIVFGMVCYTYDTRSSADDRKSLNGNAMSDSAEDLVNSFCYSDLESLYESVKEDLEQMELSGCDVSMVFIHWGTEYEDNANDTQTEIAQELSDLGVDVIVGGHPHVIQEFDVLTGESGNETLVLYSTGNALSNQRRDRISSEPDGYTEDGLTIEFTYIKYSDGEVELSEVYILPTWVEKNDDDFIIVPLDYTLDTSLWSTSLLSDAIDSYNRTIERLGGIYPALRNSLGNDEVSESIG